MTDVETFRFFAELVIGGFAAVIWWNFRKLSDRVDILEDELEETRLKLAEGYVPREELEKTFTRLFDMLDDIRKEIGHISRNQAQFRSLQDVISQMKQP